MSIGSPSPSSNVGCRQRNFRKDLHDLDLVDGIDPAQPHDPDGEHETVEGRDNSSDTISQDWDEQNTTNGARPAIKLKIAPPSEDPRYYFPLHSERDFP